MRKRILIGLLAALTASLAAITCPGQSANVDLHVQVILVTGESSRDSNSTTRTLTVSVDQLEFKETYQGAGASRRTPIKKQFPLTAQDQSDLVVLLRANSLTTDKTISQPPTKDTNRYFQISITSALNGTEHSVSIEATPTSDLKNDPVYQASVVLIERIYSIINRTEPDLRMPALLATN
jgi:hypothetical protein